MQPVAAEGRWNARRHRHNIYVAFGGRVALQQLHASDDEQKDRPSLVKSESANAVSKNNNPTVSSIRRAPSGLGAATRTVTTCNSTEQSPAFGEHPSTKQSKSAARSGRTQNPKANCVQQKQNAEADQDNRARRNFGRVDSVLPC